MGSSSWRASASGSSRAAIFFIDHNGFVDEFYVMVRPLSGALALAEAVKAQLAADTDRRSA
jgi:hypothetical protein